MKKVYIFYNGRSGEYQVYKDFFECPKSFEYLMKENSVEPEDESLEEGFNDYDERYIDYYGDFTAWLREYHIK